MSVEWTIEPACVLDGTWLIGRDKYTTMVIAPSGTPLSQSDTPMECTGWRVGSWHREPDLCLDETPPASIRTIRPADVVAITDSIGGLWVQNILETQLTWLEVACMLDAAHRPRFEDRMHTQLRAIVWHRAELMSAFPEIYEERWSNPEQLVARPAPDPDAQTVLSTVPDFSDQVLARIIASPLNSPDPQGARVLWCLLRRRLLWKLIERMPRTNLVILEQLLSGRRELGCLVERRLREEAVRGKWEPIAKHRDVVRAHEHAHSGVVD